MRVLIVLIGKEFFVRSLILTAILHLLVFPIQANIEWNTKEISHTAEIDETERDFVFPFKNAGTLPIKISRITTSCGCTVPAQIEGKIYDPGQSGEVSVQFKYGDRVGTQNKTVTVEFSELSSDNHVVRQLRDILTIKVDIPVVLTIEPGFLFWEPDEGPSTKTSRITVQDETLVTVNGIRLAEPLISARLKTITPGKEYILELKPHEEAFERGISGNILVDTSLTKKRFTVFFMVYQRSSKP